MQGKYVTFKNFTETKQCVECVGSLLAGHANIPFLALLLFGKFNMGVSKTAKLTKIYVYNEVC